MIFKTKDVQDKLNIEQSVGKMMWRTNDVKDKWCVGQMMCKTNDVKDKWCEGQMMCKKNDV